MSPFKSQAQARWMFANKPEMAKRWEDVTQNLKHLPEHVDQPPKRKKVRRVRRRR